MKFNTIGYLIGEGFRNTFKNKKSTLSAMLVMCISMLLFGFFFILGENVNHIMKSVEGAQAIRVFIVDGTENEDIKKLGEQIKQINGVDSTKVDFLSGEEGFEQFVEKYGDKAYLVEPYETIIPNSYVVNFTDLKLAKEVQEEINKLNNIDEIVSANKEVEMLINLTNGIRVFTAIILFGLIIGAIFIISNTIKLTVYARRKEISIMKYVGATNSFIRWPFIVEGIIIGILAACISILIVGGAYKIIANSLLQSPVIQELGITFVSFADMFNMIIIIYMILGIGIGVLGSSLSMKKYLEV